MEISSTGFWSGAAKELPYGWSVGLAEWIAEYLAADKETPLWDMGAGPGSYMSILRDAGFTALTGFEGWPLPPEHRLFRNIVRQDLTTPFHVWPPGNCLFLEVAEHVPSEHEDVLLDNVVNAVAPGKSLIMSWAVRDQPGLGHCSCKNNDEVIPLFERRDMVYLPSETVSARSVNHSGPGGDCPWFGGTVMCFRKGR